MGVSGAARNAPLIGDQSSGRLCMVRCRMERQISMVLRVGSGRRDSPLIAFSGDALAASNRRTVGQDCTRARRPFDRWVQGERSLPRVIDRRYGLLALKRVRHPERAMAWGMQRGCAAAPLPRWFCTTKHILHTHKQQYRVTLVGSRVCIAVNVEGQFMQYA